MYLSELFNKPDGLVKDAVHVPMTVSRLQINICTWTPGVGGADFLLSRSHSPIWDMAHMSSRPFTASQTPFSIAHRSSSGLAIARTVSYIFITSETGRLKPPASQCATLQQLRGFCDRPGHLRVPLDDQPYVVHKAHRDLGVFLRFQFYYWPCF